MVAGQGWTSLLTILGLTGSVPLTPAILLGAVLPPEIDTAAGLQVSLVAVEPVTVHPVTLAWSVRNHLWVVEATEATANPAPHGSRVVILSDRDDNGSFEHRSVFLDGLPPVTSVLDWPPGVLIAAAPDLLYAEDGNGDGIADIARRLLVGFGTQSSTDRYRSLEPDLDGWIYGAAGLAGGIVLNAESITPGAVAASGPGISLHETDFRFRPATRQIESATGLSWLGRVRNELGCWFGIDPESRVVHYPIPSHYLARNSAVTYPDLSRPLAWEEFEPLTISPASPEPVAGSSASRFRGSRSSSPATPPAPLPILPGTIALHRAPGLGPVERGSLLVVFPSQGIVEHYPLRQQAEAFTVAHPPTKGAAQLARSDDPRFHPTQARTGPDDAIWIVDNRPRPDPSTAPQGRIYRLQATQSSIPSLRDRLNLIERDPVLALRSRNGVVRDLAQQTLVNQGSAANLELLRRIAHGSELPADVEPSLESETSAASQIQALHSLDQLGRLRLHDLETALSSSHPDLRRHALRLSESSLHLAPLLSRVLELTNDSVPTVRLQLALSLGAVDSPRIATALAHLATRSEEDSLMDEAILSSTGTCALPVLQHLLSSAWPRSTNSIDLVRQLVNTALKIESPSQIAKAIALHDSNLALVAAGQLARALAPKEDPSLLPSAWILDLHPHIAQARLDLNTPEHRTEWSLHQLPLLGLDPSERESDVQLLLAWATHAPDLALRNAALQTLLRLNDPLVARWTLASWPRIRPSQRPRLIGGFLERPSTLKALLQAVDRGQVAAVEISEANRNRLITQATADLDSEMTELFSQFLPEPNTAELLDRQPSLTLQGESTTGMPIFSDRCAVCHQPASTRLRLGPDLASIGNRTRVELLTAIIDPSRLVEPAYRTYLLETTDGESFSGILRQETDHALEMVVVGGEALSLRLQELSEVRISNLSLMPEGLAYGLSAPELASLLAYLQSLR